MGSPRKMFFNYFQFQWDFINYNSDYLQKLDVLVNSNLSQEKNIDCVKFVFCYFAIKSVYHNSTKCSIRTTNYAVSFRMIRIFEIHNTYNLLLDKIESEGTIN